MPKQPIRIKNEFAPSAHFCIVSLRPWFRLKRARASMNMALHCIMHLKPCLHELLYFMLSGLREKDSVTKMFSAMEFNSHLTCR